MTDTQRKDTKRSMTWIVIGIVVLALLALSVPFLTQDRTPEAEVRPEPEAFENVQALVDWVDDELGEYNDEQIAELTADGFDRIAAALNELVHREPGPQEGDAENGETGSAAGDTPAAALADHGALLAEIDQHVAIVGDRASGIRGSDDGTAQAEHAHHAAIMTAHLVDVLTDHRYTFALAEVRPLRSAAEAIDPAETLADQRSEVDSFFQQAARSLRLLAEPSTPAWLEGRQVKPWPTPDVRTDVP